MADPELKVNRCEDCDKTFSSRFNLNRHKGCVQKHAVKSYICDVCNASFTRSDNLKRHVKADRDPTHESGFCRKRFSRESHLRDHEMSHAANTVEEDSSPIDNDDNNCETQNEDGSCEILGALNDSLKTYTFKSRKAGDVLSFMSEHKDKIKEKVLHDLSVHRGVKWFVTLNVRYIREADDNVLSTVTSFNGGCFRVTNNSEFDEQCADSFETIAQLCSNFQKEGSNWCVDNVQHIELKTAAYIPLAASSYIPLPKYLSNKKAIINVKNTDNKCFLWSVLAALHPVESNAERVNNYNQFERELDMRNIEYPVSISKIGLFESQNNLSVNVFGYDKEEVFPLRLTTLKSCSSHINLLLISDENGNNHYCFIKNLDKLLFSLTKYEHKKFYCHFCLHRFTTESLRNDHRTLCTTFEPQTIRMPSKPENKMRFKDHHTALKVPFVIYADFECCLTKLCGCLPNNEPHTHKLALHEPSGFSFVVVDIDGKSFKPARVYRGPNVVDTFLTEIMKAEVELLAILRDVKPIVMSTDDENSFERAECCHICLQQLGNDRVRDHCHLSGKYRGAAHGSCNLNHKLADFIPVIFHNLRGYDSHLIMQQLGKTKRRITCIPNTMEKYVSFTVGKLRFLDSLQFLNESLETLVANLHASGEQHFKILNENFIPDEVLLLLRKGVFPYEYVDSTDKFKETILPSKDAFFNTLKGEHISDSDYEHAINVWKKFEIKDLGAYQDLYVKSDVILLADVFQNFRALCLSFYNIDPCHCYTAPGLAWQSSLKMTQVELELFTDPDMDIFMEEGIRGGVAMICQRFSEANNKYIVGYDSAKPTKYIVYWDCNNLYGVAMSEYLPISDFRWLSSEDINTIDFKNVPDNSEKGYILEVDLSYPETLHPLHNDYPLAAEKVSVSEDMLSQYSKKLLRELHLTNNSKIKKLIPNLKDKTAYTIHYRSLKQCLSLGLEITQIRRVLEFTQKPWLKPYIDFNTEKRKAAKNGFEKDFFKLMNNAVYGKTMENVRNRIKVELVNEEKRVKKLIASPAFESFKIFSNDLVAVHSKNTNLDLNKPIYAGFTILECSKIVMYDFHYNYTKKKYGERAHLLFTDTDSLCYEISTDDVYKDMEHDADLFDTSNFTQEHFLYSERNTKVLGKMKDELSGRPIKEFIGLRAKMYSILEGNGANKKVGKGIIRSTLQNCISHEDYKMSLFSRVQQSAEMRSIRSYDHEIYTIAMRKVTLSPFDDKRYIQDDGIHTLSYGHCDIKK